MSDVQHRFLNANHAKKRHCRGALDFHMKAIVGETSRPANLVAYADLAEDQGIKFPILASRCIAANLGERSRNCWSVLVVRSGPRSQAQVSSPSATETVRVDLILLGTFS